MIKHIIRYNIKIVFCAKIKHNNIIIITFYIVRNSKNIYIIIERFYNFPNVNVVVSISTRQTRYNNIHDIVTIFSILKKSSIIIVDFDLLLLYASDSDYVAVGFSRVYDNGSIQNIVKTNKQNENNENDSSRGYCAHPLAKRKCYNYFDL